MNIEDLKEENYTLENLKKEDKWILSKLNKTIKEVTKFMDKYEFNNAGASIYDFIWNTFCDKYIEVSKFNLNDFTTKSVLLEVLSSTLKMLHPFMPYVTDEIYSLLPIKEENIMISTYPVYKKEWIFKKEDEEIEDAFLFIKNYRNIKAENNITKDFKIRFNNDKDYTLIIKMLKLEDHIIKDNLDISSYMVKSNTYEATIYFEKVMSESELESLAKEKEKLMASIERRKKLLANENYVAKAPTELVEEEKQKLKLEEERLETLQK